MEQPSSPNSRLMQVKVLYTFNDENKSNCLARCQQPLEIQTAHLDPATEIGIIELRTCIQAIVSASPELIAQLGHDYTIYAYDYSEYETPLVGQGMLSWVLASASTTPNAPAHQSKTMVTGRVCKNVLGLFSDGAKETLEVKLRLVPVPTCLQSEYLAGMEKYRSASTVVSQSNFDTAAWTTFLRANPSFGATDTAPSSPTLFAPQPQYNPFKAQATLQTDSSNFDPSFNTLTGPNPHNAEPGSRPDTPQSRAQTAKRNNPTSRPSSRASARGGKRNSKQSSNQQPADTSEAEDGPTRKRARVTQVDWNGSSTFGNNSESLRVTAATAASIRGNRPSTSGHPTASDLAAAEPGIRPPTPIPQGPAKKKPRSLARSITGMAHEIITHKPAVQSLAIDTGEQTASPESSPEKRDDSSASTPFDMPSSPPVVVDPSPAPSSPPLPALPLHDDSGFMSGNFDEEYFDADELFAASRYKSRMEDIQSDLPQPSSDNAQPKTRLHPRSFSDPQLQPADNNDGDVDLFRKRAQSSLRNFTNLEDASMEQSVSEPIQADLANVNDLPAAAVFSLPAVDAESTSFKAPTTAAQNAQSRQRSESCAIETTSAAASPAALPENRPFKGRQNSVMHEKKKQSVQDHLANAIKTGKMPRFCQNCGEISTPTWRKAYVKVVEGTPDPAALTENEGGMITWEVVDKDDSGTITSYRIIKKFTTTGDTDFQVIDLCNSCGVWLFKHRCMRPPEAWKKQDGPKGPPKPRKKSSKKKQEQETKSGDAQYESKNETSDVGEPDEGGCADSECLTREESRGSDGYTTFKKPRCERASSTETGDKTQKAPTIVHEANAKAALQRAIQSSPPRFPGSQFTPIEVDKDSESSPRPTRRLLFPSPRKPGEMKSLEDDSESPSATKLADKSGEKDKENKKPADGDSDDELDRLFDSKQRQLGHIGTTPKVNFDIDDPLKTPSKAGSSTAKLRGALSSVTKRWRESNPSTPSRAANTTLGLDPDHMTPFTRQLTQLISEANQSSDGLDPSFGGDGGIFAFSDFSTDGLDVAADFEGTDENAASAIFNMFENQLSSTDGMWNGEETLDQTMNAFLQNGQVAQDGSNEAA